MSHIGNRASARMIETAGLMGDRDWVRNRARSLLTDDFVREDRRSMVALPTADADTFVTGFDAWFEVEDGRPAMHIERVIAVRGDRCFLVELTMRFENGVTSGAHLVVGRYDRAVERLERIVAFDLDDEAAAIEELDRLSAPSPE